MTEYSYKAYIYKYVDKANILNNYFLLYCFTKEMSLLADDSYPIVDSLHVTAGAW